MFAYEGAKQAIACRNALHEADLDWDFGPGDKTPRDTLNGAIATRNRLAEEAERKKAERAAARKNG